MDDSIRWGQLSSILALATERIIWVDTGSAGMALLSLCPITTKGKARMGWET